MSIEAFAGGLRRWARRVGRRLTTPGNRTPLDESQRQRPGLRSSDTEGTDPHIIKYARRRAAVEKSTPWWWALTDTPPS